MTNLEAFNAVGAYVIVLVLACAGVTFGWLAGEWAWRKAEPSIHRLLWRAVGGSGEPPAFDKDEQD